MNALITGGAGFVGSYLAEELLRRGFYVMVIDNLSTGSFHNVKHLQDTRNFSLTVGSVTDEEVMEELIEKSDVIFHLAATVGVKQILEKPIESISNNIRGTEVVLELAHQKGNKKLILASSSEVYGKSCKVPYKEDDDRVLGPTTAMRWCYSESKAIDEFLALAYFRDKGLPTVIVRLFNTVGPRQKGRYGMVIPRFVKQALLNQPITVYGDGQQKRCFAYVEDVVRGIIALSDHPHAPGEIFNLGSTGSISILDLATMTKRVAGSDSDTVFIPYHEIYGETFEDVRNRVPDLTKVKKWINFKPETSLEEVLGRVANYYRQNPDLLNSEDRN
ncbi:UDP-glucuronate decarboxylase [Candidatus Hakubella thermalkaliphila]|uniref:UDP-glucuronate decarboxylase n=3 Tax=Candidatus Hakubella thermalkaliphila TaxID=2754717 RepID=A0A6V8Q5N6_9ACTN|nr:GDP-mannose 4,6-dehydratase [Candidatus Hakubella thermalkaliphila]GFP20010.1 UDP-glucuronate decarboxylase [Candidatus Hakubella thermalkaliphila]GFP22719.1 UDP-glucuronate decarboxylase [Candidatus Hakubella thermalkaliphila]GFP36446.1 UDP-glucuronate decarboxylase [Candidatus Hakubella thermalkaliphila]GFP39750.1 UDP-glucuronate decarboxylase [Candidatus Hakubella thermalkaliphila]GFP41007.1 UDP-glucuronate decarboxylase [Candidatus Hakubella thermalkaliphila]